jgi:serine/threonine-protein kinase
MATVFRARDTQLRRDVAIKVLFPHLARREETVRRFAREARAAAGLDHANILRVLDVGGDVATDDPPFIVMELVRGRSLLQEIEQRGPMLSEVVAAIGALLADALAAAHVAAIVHRDMKPANVMVSSTGRVLLTDFGVARLESEDASLVTKTGALLGTPAYMSPEQASGDTATAKSDLYSLGATLYQLATGALPYAGSPAKVMAQIAAGAAVPAMKKRPAVGPDLSRAIEQLMRPEAEQRTATSAIAAKELRAIAAAGGLADPLADVAAFFTDADAFVKARTPAIVDATIAASEKALAGGSLPRAMSLADRASALAPDDPRVAALIERVSAGGRSEGRKRILAFVLLGAAVVGGGAFGVLKLASSSSHAVAHLDATSSSLADATENAVDSLVVVDASLADAEAVVDSVIAIDAALPTARDAVAPTARDAAIPTGRDAAISTTRDAGSRTSSDANGTLVDAAVAVMAIDAPVAVPIDAAPIDKPATGTLVIKSDRWCDVTVDGAPRGQLQSASASITVELPAGSHDVVCKQSTSTGDFWAKPATVIAGKTVIVRGELAQTIDVRLDVDAILDGVPHKRGEVVRLSRGSHDVKTSSGARFVDFSSACHLGADLQCRQ